MARLRAATSAPLAMRFLFYRADRALYRLRWVAYGIVVGALLWFLWPLRVTTTPNCAGRGARPADAPEERLLALRYRSDDVA